MCILKYTESIKCIGVTLVKSVLFPTNNTFVFDKSSCSIYGIHFTFVRSNENGFDTSYTNTIIAASLV